VSVRLALAQAPALLGDKQANLRRAAELVEEAAARRADAVVFPELFLTGYLIRERARELAERPDGPSVAALADLARRHEILLMVGFPEESGSDRPYNSACLIERDGSLVGLYRKTHLFADEPRWFTPGDRFDVFETSLGRVSPLICYDLEFPEPARAVALLGARLVLVSTANMEPYGSEEEVHVRARALENHFYVAVANTVGEDAAYRYFGQSKVADPSGRVVARAGPGPELVVADLDLSLVDAARDSSPYLARRRPDLYSPLANEPART
jgi:5-aminopentanamidase